MENNVDKNDLVDESGMVEGKPFPTERWFRLPALVRVHPVQNKLFTYSNEKKAIESCELFFKYSKIQYKVVAAGRRSFKTERAKRKFVIKAMYLPNMHYFMAAPTRGQAEKIFWNDLKELSPKWYLKKRPQEAKLVVTFKNNSSISVVGLEEYERIEGVLWHGGVISEFQKTDPLFFGKTLQPILNDTGGECILEGRPLGKNHFYDLFLQEKKAPDDWKSFHWTSEEILTEKQINDAKRDLSPEDYAREYLASFDTGSQSVYYCYKADDFPKGNNIRGLYEKIKGEYVNGLKNWTFILTCDFNVAEYPMSWTLGVRDGEIVYWIKSFSFQYTNTLQMCEIIDREFESWGKYPNRLIFYGDYAGTHLSSNSSLTDWQIIERYFESRSAVEIRIQRTDNIRDRVGATNSRFLNTLGERRMFVDPEECFPLVRDLEKVEWDYTGRKLNGNNPLDTHNSDSISHYCDYEFNIQGSPTVIQF